ncbi:MAG: hypothetical protein ACI4L9_03220 [Candidatus Coproplasma sp.]
MAESRVKELQGNDLADDYVRTHLPKGRWADTWDLFKSSFVKLVIINVLTLLFFVPGVALMYFRLVWVSSMGALYPFAANVTIATLTPSTVGLSQSIILTADLMFYSALIVAGLIASVGLSGAAYSIKKLINTHGQFTVKGYFHGVKVCYFNTALPVLVFMIFLLASVVVSDWADLAIATGAGAGGPITAKVFIIIATVLVGIYAMWVLAVGVSYKVKFWYLLKNSFVLLVGTFIQTVFMIAFALLPVWITLLGLSVQFFLVLGVIFFLFIGLSFIVLVWMAFTQWVFDCFIEPAVKSEKQAARAKMTPKQLEAEKLEEERAAAREILAAGKSELVGRPIKPIEGEGVSEIAVAFGRGDIAKAQSDRAQMDADVKSYYDKHIKDAKYVEYEKLFAEREKALQPTDKKGKKKKISSDNLLG